MAASFDTALAEFAAVAAAFNARALRRAGLLDDFELGTMHAFLEFVDRHAELDGDEAHASTVRSLTEILPADADMKP